jgi:hypothetical protein
MKKMMFALLLGVSAASFVSACKSKKHADKAQPVAVQSIPVNAVQVDSSFVTKESGITVDSLSISGNTLNVYLKYGGGCAQHDIDLVWNKVAMKSLPPQLPLGFKHDAHGDACKKLVSEMRPFDLTPLKSSGYKKMTLNIQNASIVYIPQ